MSTYLCKTCGRDNRAAPEFFYERNKDAGFVYKVPVHTQVFNNKYVTTMAELRGLIDFLTMEYGNTFEYTLEDPGNATV